VQNHSKPRLPKWLTYSIVCLFCGHFFILTIFQFSTVYLPVRLHYWTDHYVSPWFFQNWKVFAPDPPTLRRLFVYRTLGSGTWSAWQNPAFPYLQEHWSNRFSSASEMHDMIEALGDNLAFTAARTDISTLDNMHGKWEELPAHKSAKTFVLQEHPELDSLQFAVLIEHHRLIENGVKDSFQLYLFSKVGND
jgi:hypothetical protein